MEFLKQRAAVPYLHFISTIIGIALFSGGCTQAISPKFVTSIPMVMIQEVPIPNQAKQRDEEEEVLSEDSAFSTWFIGSEGWETDATQQAMSHPSMRKARESYFEAQLESLFVSILAFNYESVIFRGHWVRMVPQQLPPIDSNPILESSLPTSPKPKEAP